MATLDERFYLDPKNSGRFGTLQSLVTSIGRSSDSTEPGNVSDWHSAFCALLRSRELEVAIAEILVALSRECPFEPNWMSALAEEWFIADGPRFSLRAFVAKPANDTVFTSLPYDCLVGNLGPAVHFTRHKFPPDCNREVFERGLRLQRGVFEELTPLQSVVFSSATDAPEYLVTEATLLVELSLKAWAPLVWVFDTTEKSALMCTSSYEAPVRNHAVAESLQHLASKRGAPMEPSLDILKRLTFNKHHHVRWRALQSLCALDFEVAKPYLLRARDDPHPLVSDAARKAAQRLAIT
jgi:hypothetical protein